MNSYECKLVLEGNRYAEYPYGTKSDQRILSLRALMHKNTDQAHE